MKSLSKFSGKLSFSIILFATLFAMPFSFAESKYTEGKNIKERNVDPTDEIDEIYNNCHGRLSKKGVAFIKQNFIYHTEPCRKIPEDGGGLWRCTYSKGLVVYNCFRRCRGSVEAAKYFLGLSNGDCDAFRFVNNQKKTCAIPAKRMGFCVIMEWSLQLKEQAVV